MQVIADRTTIIRQYGTHDSPSQLEFGKKHCQYESEGDLHHQFLTMRAPKECA